MDNFLVYSSESSVTGKALGEALEIPHGSHIPSDPINILIRWGSRATVDPYPVRVINKLKALKLASNKLESLVSLDNAGIRVPPFGGSPKGFPCLGRKEHHTQGNDIVLCMQQNDVKSALDNGCLYFTNYIPTKAEYRVHVFNGEIIKISQKVEDEESDEPNVVPWIRNHGHGHIFVNPRRTLSSSDSSLAIEAVTNLGLNFGAVDLIVSDDGFPYVLEVNTAPALGDNSLDVYVNKFKEILNGEAAVEA